MKTNLSLLRVIGLLEGLSLIILLGVSVPMKYAFDMEESTNTTGMIHGILFILYILMVLLVSYQFKWNFKTILIAIIASFLPFGTFVVDKKIFRKN